MNRFIGEPNQVINDYTNSQTRRSISDMTEKECRLILDIAYDNDNWKGLCIDTIEIKSAYDNFVEGIAYLSNKSASPIEFSIRYDGTIEMYRATRNDKNKIIDIKYLKIYNFADIILIMMKMNFNITKHLEEIVGVTIDVIQ